MDGFGTSVDPFVVFDDDDDDDVSTMVDDDDDILVYFKTEQYTYNSRQQLRPGFKLTSLYYTVDDRTCSVSYGFDRIRDPR